LAARLIGFCEGKRERLEERGHFIYQAKLNITLEKNESTSRPLFVIKKDS